MKQLIHKITPKFILSIYHLILAELATFIYHHPSEKMIIIGVTGTNGKSTIVNLISKILEENGEKVGFTSTMNFKVGEKEWMNKTKMTMLGRFALQKILKDMVDAKCKYAIVETSSEGISQHRNKGINYDLAIFTNLTPEHIESHGSFKNYKKAKGKLFKSLTKKYKSINGNKVLKTIVVNNDDEHSKYFLHFKADNKITFSIKRDSLVKGENIKVTGDGSSFLLNGVEFNIAMVGEFNVSNSLGAIAVAQVLGVDLEVCKKALEKIKGIPGRIEFIDEGQDFKVIVDYAYEPASVNALYSVVKLMEHNNVVHLLGSMGGGRDKARRPALGKIAGYNADYVVVANEDPCDDDPQEIIDQVAQGSIEAGKILDQNLFKVLDRTEGIEKALSLAKKGDVVLITGKGSEQVMAIANGKKVPWDDREVVRSILQKNK